MPEAVQEAHGPRLTLAIDPEGATLAELKAKVEAQTGVPAVSQSLSLDGGEGEADEGLLSGQGVASGGTLVLTLPPFADYQIAMPETLRLVVPPSAVASRQAIAANTTLVIMPTAGFAELNGSLLDELSEGSLCAPPPLLLGA